VEQKTVKTLFSPDGRRRVDIYRRDDGLFGFGELARYEGGSLTGDGYWAPLGAYSTITETAEAAEREARASVAWLIQISN